MLNLLFIGVPWEDPNNRVYSATHSTSKLASAWAPSAPESVNLDWWLVLQLTRLCRILERLLLLRPLTTSLSWLHTKSSILLRRIGYWTYVLSPCYTSGITDQRNLGLQHKFGFSAKRCVFTLSVHNSIWIKDNITIYTFDLNIGMLFHNSVQRETRRLCVVWTGCFLTQRATHNTSPDLINGLVRENLAC